MSEDAAQRRCRAARFAREFPRLLEMVADSSLHLTGLLLIGPHLTIENQDELLRRVALRRKKEVETSAVSGKSQSVTSPSPASVRPGAVSLGAPVDTALLLLSGRRAPQPAAVSPRLRRDPTCLLW